MSEVQAILVDMDGTLARTVDANGIAYVMALAEFGVDISVEAFEERARGRNWRQFLPEILHESGIIADSEAIATRKMDLYKTELVNIAINAPLVKLLETSRLQGLKIALVTSASSSTVNALLGVKGLGPLFDVVVTGDDVQYHKPDPEPYALAAEWLGVKPGECLVFEDSDIGIKSATAFGGHVIRVVF